MPQIQVTRRPRRRRHRYGLKPGDVRRAAAVIVAGEEVGDIHVDGKVYDVIVWSTPSARAQTCRASATCPIDTPGGGHVRLADVADVRIAPTPNQISREDNSRRIDVGANVEGPRPRLGGRTM